MRPGRLIRGTGAGRCRPRHLLLALGLALAAGAAEGGAEGGAGGGDRVVRSLLEMREETVVLQEHDLSCGAAALTTLLRYQHGVPMTEREVAIGLMRQERYVENPALVRIRHGFSLLDLKRFADARGFTGTGFGGLSLADLVERAPIMVPVRINGYNHFVVFRGAYGNRVLLADPAFGNRTMTRARFERVWLEIGSLGRVGFIVGRNGQQSPPGRLAARPKDFVTLR